MSSPLQFWCLNNGVTLNSSLKDPTELCQAKPSHITNSAALCSTIVNIMHSAIKMVHHVHELHSKWNQTPHESLLCQWWHGNAYHQKCVKNTVYPVHWILLATYRMTVNTMGMATARARKVKAPDWKGHWKQLRCKELHWLKVDGMWHVLVQYYLDKINNEIIFLSTCDSLGCQIMVALHLGEYDTTHLCYAVKHSYQRWMWLSLAPSAHKCHNIVLPHKHLNCECAAKCKRNHP